MAAGTSAILMLSFRSHCTLLLHSPYDIAAHKPRKRYRSSHRVLFVVLVAVINCEHVSTVT